MAPKKDMFEGYSPSKPSTQVQTQEEQETKALPPTSTAPKALPPTSVTPKELASRAPESQSRQPYALDEDAEAASMPSGPPASKPSQDVDPELRSAWDDILSDIVDKWLKLDGDAPGSVEDFRFKVNTDENRKLVCFRLYERYAERSAASGHTLSNEESKKIQKQIVDLEEKIMNESIDEAFRRSNDKLSPENKRKTVNRTLRLIKLKATCYDILGVKQSATTAEIRSAWMKLATSLHPDKNDDKASVDCMSGKSITELLGL